MSKLAFRILKEEKLILEYYNGIITLEDIFSLKSKMHLDPEYVPTYNVIHDFTDAKLNINEKELCLVKEFLEGHSEIIDKRKGACISNNPHDVAITMLVSFVLRHYPITINVFNTIEAAMRWLNIKSVSSEDIKEYLHQLNSHTHSIQV